MLKVKKVTALGKIYIKFSSKIEEPKYEKSLVKFIKKGFFGDNLDEILNDERRLSD